jgi:CHAT domain-containing protein/Tfp pilus assembly protein PilF
MTRAGVRNAIVAAAVGLFVTLMAGAPALAAPQPAAPTPAIAHPFDQYAPDLARLNAAGDWKGVEALARTALAKFDPTGKAQTFDAAAAELWLGIGLQGQKRLPEAEVADRRALAVFEQVSGPQSADVATALTVLGVLLRAQGKSEDAVAAFKRALAIREKVLGPQDPQTLATLDALGSLLAASDHEEEAIPLLRRLLAAREKTSGPNDTFTMGAAQRLAGALEEQADYKEAEALFRRVLAYSEKTYGPDAEITAGVLASVALSLEEQSRYPEAEPLYRRVLAIDEKAKGPDDIVTATALNNLALLLDSMGRYGEAEPLYRRSMAIDAKVLGDDAPGTAAAMSNLAQTVENQGRYAEAEVLYRRALAAQEKAHGPMHRDVASGLNNLASALEDEGRYPEAEALYRRAVAIDEKVLGPQHPGLATDLDNFAGVLEEQGRYADAEALYRRALAIREKTLGPTHADTAISLADLAEDLLDQGHAREAETLYRRALAIREAALGPEHPDTAGNLDALAITLQTQGRLGEAELLFKRSLGIREKVLGPTHPDTAVSLANLALVLRDEGRMADAEPLLRRALAIDERALGPDHPGTAVDLSNLALVLSDEGRFGEAEALTRRNLAINQKSLGPSHPTTAASLNNLAYALMKQDHAVAAEPLYQQALAIDLKALGPAHRETQARRVNLAFDEALLGRLDQATPLYRDACQAMAARPAAEASRAAKAAGDQRATWCSRQLALTLWQWSAKGGGPAPADQPPALAREAFAQSQRASTSSAGEALAQGSALALATKQGVGQEAQDYEAALKQLDRLNAFFAIAAGSTVQQAPQKQAAITAARQTVINQIAALEQTLKTRAPGYWDYRAPLPLGVDALQTAAGEDAKLLHANEAVVVWMTPPGKDKGLVFAVSKTGFAWAQVGLSGDDVQAKVEALRFGIDPASFSRGGRADHAPRSTPFDRTTAHELYLALLGDPKVVAVINGPGVDTLIVVPSDALTSLPPSLLVVDKPSGADDDPAAQAATHWLVRDKALAVLPSVASLRTLRQLLPASRGKADLKLLAMADPDFKGSGVTPERPAAGPAGGPAAAAPSATLERDGQGTDALAQLPSLYGTLAEGKALAGLLDPGDRGALLLGPDATKTNLMKHQADGTLARVQVVSFSTHGLLTGDFTGLNEPALALAHPPTVGAAPGDDGLLKASEAAALSLNADWVVLSACNTGSGGASGAEGLSGLARAFFHAGANTLLVSHWRVDDNATPLLIIETFRLRQGGKPVFATGALDAGMVTSPPRMTKAQALRVSMLEMIDNPDHKYVDPRFWAPFVLVGETE